MSNETGKETEFCGKSVDVLSNASTRNSVRFPMRASYFSDQGGYKIWVNFAGNGDSGGIKRVNSAEKHGEHGKT